MLRGMRGVRMSALRNEFLSLTWAGRAEMAWYLLRNAFVAPADDADRCYMGAPIGPHIRCPRRAVGRSPWCGRHGGES